jgi:hypothetical protein
MVTVLAARISTQPAGPVLSPTAGTDPPGVSTWSQPWDVGRTPAQAA